MLVLTRRAGESIVIGDEVHVVVLEVRGDTVRLGIEAPRSVQVHRAEVYAEVQAANAAAAGVVDNLEAVANRLLARPKRQPHPSGRMPRPVPGPPRGTSAAPTRGRTAPAESVPPVAPSDAAGSGTPPTSSSPDVEQP